MPIPSIEQYFFKTLLLYCKHLNAKTFEELEKKKLYKKKENCELEYKYKLKTDIDECELESSSSVCDVNANCSNTIGSFSCHCKEGYYGDGTQCDGWLILAMYLKT